MFKNYLKVALRSFRKHKTYATVNIVGLAVGMASCALIFMLVYHEWSYDRFHDNEQSIYRTYLEYHNPDGEPSVQAMMTPTFTPSIVGSFPAIERASRYVAGDQDLEVEDNTFRHRVAEVDADFFEMFSFPLLAGNPGTALIQPNSMVITAELATGLFDLQPERASEAVGRIVSITRNEVTYDFSISAVAANIPQNSSLTLDAAISFENYENLRIGGNNWGGRTSTYLQLSDGATKDGFEEALKPFVETEFASYVEDMRGAGRIADGEGSHALLLQPLASLHQNPTIWVPYEVSPHNPLYSYVLTGIGLLILLIACINFMTLSVGQSSSRAREVGMRKVMGAYRGQLMKQFWGESFVLTAVSLILGIGVSALVLPSFNNLVGTQLSFSGLSPELIILVIVALTLVVGLLAGGYPSVVLSRFVPALVLKGDTTTGGQSRLTQALVVLQYTISIGLIVCTLIMSQQLNFMFDKDLGYEQDLVVAVNTRHVSRADADGVFGRLRDGLLPFDQITQISRSGSSFTRGSDRNTWSDNDGITRIAFNFGVDYEYIDLMGMEIVAGRNFSREFPSDPTDAILVNEALVREFGIEDPVGHTLAGWLSFLIDESPTIIGVVKDYHFQSLRQDVQPAVMNMLPNYYNYMGAVLFKIKGGDIAGSISLIEAEWSQVLPGKPFTYSFLDQDIARQYQIEQRWRRIVTYSSILAIVIACLGLFGLAILTVTRRTKEIGIRKVLGASIPGLMSLVSREFAILVIVSSIIAAPLAYYAMSSWLQNFAFHIDIGPGVFILAALGALSIALLTVSFHSIRAAATNPVDTIRYE